MATQDYIVITDGTDTVTIADGAGGATSFKLQRGWAPKTAALRQDLLAQRGPYEDVVEEMDLVVSGATPAAVLANLNTLCKLLDKAERFERQEHASQAAVVLKVSLKGATVSSTGSPMEAVILGRAPGDNTQRVGLPASLAELTTQNALVVDVRLRFRRRGLWTHTLDSKSATNVNNGDLVTFTFTEERSIPNPIDFNITNVGYGKSSGKRFHGGFLLFGEQRASVSPIAIINAEGGAGATGFTSSADAARNARNGSVLTYTAPGTAEQWSNSLGAPVVLPANVEMVALFANVRPSATSSFRLRAHLPSGLPPQFTPHVAIPANAVQYPYWVSLGLLPVNQPSGSFSALYLLVTAEAASAVLQIDTVVLCDVGLTQVLSLIGPSDSDLNFTATESILNLNHKLNDGPHPIIGHSGANNAVPYAGDAVISTRVTACNAVLLLTGGGNGAVGDEYRQASIGGSDAVLQNTWDIGRRRGYLVPE